MAETEGERQKRESEQPGPYPHCPAPKTREERWPATVVRPVPDRRCPRLPHPHPQGGGGISVAASCTRLHPGAHTSRVAPGSAGVPAPGPSSGRRAGSRRPLRPQPPSLALPGARAGAGVPGGRRRLGGAGGRRGGGGCGGGRGGGGGGGGTAGRAAPLYTEAPGACPVRGGGGAGPRPAPHPLRPRRSRPDTRDPAEPWAPG